MLAALHGTASVVPHSLRIDVCLVDYYLQELPDGCLRLDPGCGSCAKLRAALQSFPPHVPLVAYNSCSNLSAAVMVEACMYFKQADCPMLQPFQATLRSSQGAPVQPPRCVWHEVDGACCC